MNKSDAKKIAENITLEQLRDMFESAKNNITDWTQVSAVNRTLSKGFAWNLLFPAINTAMAHPIARKNMIWEFGDYLPEELKVKKPSKKEVAIVHHQEPIF